jgi:hypothetical protein
MTVLAFWPRTGGGTRFLVGDGPSKGFGNKEGITTVRYQPISSGPGPSVWLMETGADRIDGSRLAVLSRQGREHAAMTLLYPDPVPLRAPRRVQTG